MEKKTAFKYDAYHLLYVGATLLWFLAILAGYIEFGAAILILFVLFLGWLYFVFPKQKIPESINGKKVMKTGTCAIWKRFAILILTEDALIIRMPFYEERITFGKITEAKVGQWGPLKTSYLRMETSDKAYMFFFKGGLVPLIISPLSGNEEDWARVLQGILKKN